VPVDEDRAGHTGDEDDLRPAEADPVSDEDEAGDAAPDHEPPQR